METWKVTGIIQLKNHLAPLHQWFLFFNHLFYKMAVFSCRVVILVFKGPRDGISTSSACYVVMQGEYQPTQAGDCVTIDNSYSSTRMTDFGSEAFSRNGSFKK